MATAGQELIQKLMGLDMALPQPQAAAPPQAPAPAQTQPGFVGRLLQNFNDPNFRQALTLTGAQMMRTPGYGQNFGDIAANALSTGVTSLQQLRAQQAAEALREREAQRAERTTGAYVEATGEQTTTSKERRAREAEEAAYAKGQRPVMEMRAANAETRAGEGARAEVELKGAQARRQDAESRYLDRDRPGGARGGAGGGRQPQDIQKIEMLSRKYQADGLDKVAADARAVEVLDLQKAVKTPGELAQTLYTEKLRAWQADIGNLGKPLDPNVARGLLDDAIKETMELSRIDVASQGPVRSGADPTNPATGMRILDPRIQALVLQAKERNHPPEKIREALISAGADPSLYGY